MFDASIGEFFVCGVVGLVVLGPEKFIRTVTVTTKMIGQIKNGIKATVDELEQAAQLTEMQEDFDKLQTEIQQLNPGSPPPEQVAKAPLPQLPPLP